MFKVKRHLQSGYVTNIVEEIKFEGVWWLPQYPDDKVAGTLHIYPDNGIWLQLVGTFGEDVQNPTELIDYDIILGKQASGYKITLRNNSESHRNTPFGSGYVTQIFFVETVLSGSHFEKKEDAIFDEVLVNFTYLKDWMRNVGLGRIKKEEGMYKIPYDKTRYSTVSELIAETSIGKIKIKSSPYTHENRGDSDKFKISINEFVKFYLSKKISIDEIINNAINPVRDFLNLATLRPNTLTKFIVYPDIEDEKVRKTNKITVYTQFDNPRIERQSLFNKGIILFLAKAIESNFNDYFNNWWEFYFKNNDIIQLFFGVHYNKRMHPTNRFLNVVQSLESYHRSRKGKYEIDPKDHKERCSSIYSKVNEAEEKWLKKFLPYMNRKSLSTRIKELTKEIDQFSKHLVKLHSKFSRWVVDSRNFYTHREKREGQKVATGNILDLLTFSLIWLIRIHFLVEIGFSEDKRDEILNEHDQFKLICDANSKEAPWS